MRLRLGIPSINLRRPAMPLSRPVPAPLAEFDLRRLHQPPVLIWSLAFITGIALRLAGAETGFVALAVALTASLGILAAWQTPARTRARLLTMALLALAPLALLAGHWHADQPDHDATWIDELGGSEATLTGVVQRDGETRWGRKELWLRVESAQVGNERVTADGLVFLRAPPNREFEAGDRISAQASLEPVAALEGGFGGYLAREGVSATGYARELRRLESPGRGWWLDAVSTLRRSLNDALRDALPPPVDGIAQAMLTGHGDAIDAPLREDLARAGIIHLVVVSGANVHLLAALILFTTTWLIGRRWATGLVLAAVGAYVFIAAGDPVAEPPVFRAGVMAAVLMIALSLGRRTGAIYAVALAAALLAALSPPALASPSFQLTLAGTLAVVAIAPAALQRFFEGGGPARAGLDFLILNSVATLATMPFIAWHFDRVSIVSLPANLAVAPFFTWMFAGTAATAAIGLASDALAAALAWPLAGLPLSWLALVADLAAAPSWAAVAAPREVALFAFAAIAVIALSSFPAGRLGSRRESGQRGSRLAFAAAIAAAMFLAASAAVVWTRTDAADDGRFAVHFLDVGQGDAALIRAPSGATMLVDGGPDPDRLLAAMRDVLPANHEAIDAVVLTHPQSDHAGGLFAVLDRYDVGRLIVTEYNSKTEIGRSLEAAAKARNIQIDKVAHGDQIEFAHGDVTADVLWPKQDRVQDDLAADMLWPHQERAKQADPNTVSIVLRIIYENTTVLLTGDITAAEEIELARLPCANSQPCDLRANVLKVAHQGSRSSSTDLFLRRVRPGIAVVSAGARNPHGHPHPKVMYRLEKVAERVLTTPEHGTISIFSDGGTPTYRMERHTER